MPGGSHRGLFRLPNIYQCVADRSGRSIVLSPGPDDLQAVITVDVHYYGRRTQAPSSEHVHAGLAGWAGIADMSQKLAVAVIYDGVTVVIKENLGLRICVKVGQYRG